MDSTLTVVTAAQTQDLTTLETATDELGNPAVTDATLERWISSASDQIAQYCDRVFGQETVQQVFRLKSNESVNRLPLDRFPVTSITSVAIDGTAQDSDTYAVDAASGLLDRLCDDVQVRWCGSTITVVYTAGYELVGDLPRTIEDACLVMLRHRLSTRDRDPMLKSLELPGVSTETFWVGTTGDNPSMPPEATGLLERHRRISV